MVLNLRKIVDFIFVYLKIIKERNFMGEIYKITNILNGKVYIGATKRNLRIRKEEHLKSYNNKNLRIYNFKIYKAMRKFGIENFEFETIEICKNELLSEREKYYIKLYDSKNNGYNEAIGGKGKPLWTDKQIEACKILYENNWLIKDISDLFNSNPKTVGEKLREKYNIDTKKNSIVSFGREICAKNKQDEITNFNSITNAAKFVMENNFTKSKKLSCVIAKISDALRNNKHSAYGFKWFYKNVS